MAENLSIVQKLKKSDKRWNYIIGYRNLINIAIIAVGWYGMLYYPGAEGYALIVFIFGGRSFLTQLYQNVDSVEVMDRV